MTRAQFTIITVLVALNVIVFCVGPVLLLGPTRLSMIPLISTALPPPTLYWPPTTSPATVTPAPSPTPTSLSTGIILAAVNKAKAAASYRLEFTMTVKGDLGGIVTAANNQEYPMLSFTSETGGKDTHVTMKGYAALAFTGDMARPVEMIQVGGKSYVRGPVPLLGAKDSRWYVLPASPANAATAPNPDEFLSVFGARDVDLGKLALSGSESLDGKRCDIYSAAKDTALSAFMALGPTTLLNEQDLARLQASPTSAEYKLWVCDDGYFHQLKMSFEGQDNRRAGQTVGINLTMRVHDFGSAIKITAPAQAIPAVNPLAPTATPTVKRN